MKLTPIVFSALLALSLSQCRNSPSQGETNTASEPAEEITGPEAESDAVAEGGKEQKNKEEAAEKLPAGWSELTDEQGFQMDIRYATTNNFTKKKIYDCGRCFLRPEAADKIREIQAELKEKHGYGIKLFDCFRPRPYQQRLWDIVPDPDYVTPPQKGSMHSRGLAVDLTITDGNGDELDMGTPFDFFGKEAHHAYQQLPADVLENRVLLKSTMEKYGFRSITTEWWHYSLNVSYPLDSWVWPCEQ